MESRRRALILGMSAVALLALSGSAGAAVQLQLKLEEGRTYYERLRIERKITQVLMGQEQITDHEIGVGRKLDVLEVDAEGNMRIECKYVWSRFRESSPMGSVDYDSSHRPGVPGGAEGFAALLGQSYTIRLSPKGEVLDVNGIEDLAKAVRKKVPEELDTSSGVSPVAFLLSEDAVRETTKSLLGVYPAEPVELGASWSARRLTTQGTTILAEFDWKLTRLWLGAATIASTCSMKSDPEGPPIEVGGTTMKADLSGTQEGTAEVHQETGLIKKSSSLSVLKGKIGIVAADGELLDTMTIPITFETATTFEMSARRIDMASW
ncbi:MAG: hypothetical protein KBE65_17890 [Phycisphaerae bacterium]|nr:hypothetical protein [Phycisphaerae bacterium]